MSGTSTSERLLDTVHRTQQVLDYAYSLELNPLGITPRQYILMEAIAERGTCSQTELVEATGIDRSTVSDVSTRLMRMGMIRRKRSTADSRRYNVSLTAEGEVTLKRARRAIADIETRIPAPLHTTLLSALNRIPRLFEFAPVAQAAE